MDSYEKLRSILSIEIASVPGRCEGRVSGRLGLVGRGLGGVARARLLHGHLVDDDGGGGRPRLVDVSPAPAPHLLHEGKDDREDHGIKEKIRDGDPVL